MNKCFIPKDKFNIKGLEECWKELREECETGTFDYNYFCELSKITYKLLCVYGKNENIPKEILFLFGEMYCYTQGQTQINELFEFSKEIISFMIHVFSNTLAWNKENMTFEKKDFNEGKNILAMMYKDKTFDIDADTFEFREFFE